MTTTVKVSANHGWPVRVIPLDPKTGEPSNEWGEDGQVVPKDTERTFSVHSSCDLRIHEIQPDEEQPEIADPA